MIEPISKTADVVVIGGGPSGLAAAFRLKQAGAKVRILEMSDRVGGKMRTTPRGGFLVDQGAFFLPTTHRALLSLAAEAGLGEQILPGGFVLATIRDRQIHDIDGYRLARSVLGTKLLSTRGKLEAIKLLPELWKAREAVFDRMPRCGIHDTQTLAQWARGRFSEELREYLLDTTLRGIFATSSETSPRVDFLAILALLKGATLVAFRDGMGSYAERLAQSIEVCRSAEALVVEPHGNRVSVVWRDAQGEHRDEAAACVVAVPALVARRILPALDATRREFLQLVRHGKTFVLNIGLRRSPPGVSATYIQVPRSAHPFVTGIMLDHHKAPGRAPPGKGLLSVAVLDAWCDGVWEQDDATVRDAILDAVDQLLPGTRNDVEFLELHRWFQEYNQVGFYQGLGEFRAACERDTRLQLAGDFHSMQNLDAATTAGLHAAQRLLASGVLSGPTAKR